MDKMREEFEAWAISQKWCVDMAGGIYINTYVGCAWQAWQASRKALVVELPEEECETMHAGAVCAALDAAGVAYK